jgi:hypothetical protein
MSQLNNTYVDILPFKQENPWGVVNFYSLNTTGVGGRFVSIVTGNQDPALSAGDFASIGPGASFDGTVSLRYEQPRKVRYAAAGDNKYAVLGLALNGTVEFDEQGRKVVLLDPAVKSEKQIVASGETIPVATDGIYTLKQAAYVGTPVPGSIGIITGSVGQIAFIPAANAASYIGSGLDVCKVLSTSGSAFGGYVQIKFTL